MIDALWLILIIPACTVTGFILGAIMSANGDEEFEDYHIKYDYKKSPDHKK